MTSWQDQPPQTRRQAREHQRAADGAVGSAEAEPMPVSRRAATVASTPAGEVPDVTTPFSFSSTQRDSDARQPSTDAPPVRPRAPRYESLSFDTLLAASHAGEPANAPMPEDDRPPAPVTYLPGVQPPAPSYQPAQPVAPAAPYPSAPVTQPVAPGVAPQASVPAAEGPTGPDGHLLTRRELRAMLQAQAANDAVQTDENASGSQPSTPAAPVAAPTAAVPSVVAPIAPVPQAPPAFSTPATPAVVAPAVVEQPRSVAPPSEQSAPSFADLLGGSVPGTQEAPATRRIVPPAAPARSAEQSAVPQVPVQQTPVSVVSTPVTVQGTSVPVPTALPTQDTPVSAPTTDPQLAARSAGHWSTMNDESVLDAGSTPRSAVSSGSVTTANALILPSIPSVGIGASPLTSTGELIVTGSIDLPRSLGSTGQHPDHFDSSDIDRLFEESDAAPATSSVAPVRASTAVATHTSTRGMITPPKSRGNKLPVTLAVTAAFLALGVAALLVAGYVFHAF